MTDLEAAHVVAEMAAIWPQRSLSSPEVAAWKETLASMPADAAKQAMAEFKTEKDWPPTHNQFVTAVQRIARLQASSRALPAVPLEVCELCDDTGWREALKPDGYSEVSPCRCSAGRRNNHEGSHASDCSCHRCHYGDRVPSRREGVSQQEVVRPDFDVLRAQLGKRRL